MRLRDFFKVGFVLLAFMGYIATLYSQSLPTGFKNYAAKDGLSSNTVYSILKGRFGFLWLATEDGLSRFDGTSFKVYRHDPKGKGSLRVNHISALYEAVDGCLWIGTNGGALSFYDRKRDTIVNYRPNDEQFSTAITAISGDSEGYVWVTSYGALYLIDPISKKLINKPAYKRVEQLFAGKVSLCVFQDSKQQMWIGTDSGLYVLDKHLKKIKSFKHQAANSNSLADNYVTTIAEDGHGQIWVGTLNGLSKWIPSKQAFLNFNHTEGKAHISSSRVYALAADGKDGMWIGTDEGLDVMNVSSYVIRSFKPDSRNAYSLSSRSIRSILIDQSGLYWVGTFQGGLNKFDKNLSQFSYKQYNPFDPYGLRSPIVTSFAEYRNDVFVGTDGGGLHFLHRATNRMEHLNIAPFNNNCVHDLSILTMEMSKDSCLWIGTYMEGLFCYNPLTRKSKQIFKGHGSKQLNHNDVFCLKEDRAGNLWIGTNGGGVNVLRAKSGNIDKYVHDPQVEDDPSRPSSNYIRAIEEGEDGRIWIGTFGSGLSVFNPKSKRFSFYNKLNSGLPSDYVLSLKRDKQGNMWVGTSGNGVGLLRKGTTKFVTFSESDGLINGMIHRIVEDSTGKLWFSTNKGLSCYNSMKNEFKSFSYHVGLQPGPFMLGAGLCLSDGEIFFGGQNGFNHFNPVDLKTNKNAPQIVLTDLKIDNQSISPSKDGPIRESLLYADEINLKYKQNFSIAFEALNFTVPEENQYEYMLEGFDKDWIPVGKEHMAYYTNLDPGEYIFHVRASNNDGVWNKKGKSVYIMVAPPFWRTIYAYIAYIFMALGALLYIRHRGIKKLESKFALERERQQARQLLEQERKEAEHLHKLDRMKIKFLTNLSHEFRTPISLIMGPVDNLLNQIQDRGPSSQLNLIKRNARRLLNLVNQLLDFRKMEERELKLHCSEGELIAFLEEVSDSFNDMAFRKKIDYAFSTTVSEASVLFDHDKIERILFNLLSNAFKFTPEGGVIRVNVDELEEQQLDHDYLSLVIAIRDSGIGIPKVAQQRIFESFFQHDTGADVLNQGTGIGLSIVQAFVKMHGGDLNVSSEPGKGSCFSFCLRLERTKEDLSKEKRTGDPSVKMDDAPIAPAGNPLSPQKPAVLIVEDDDDFRFYIKDNLKSSYQLYEAADGKEGWQRALFYHPDIIVCDVQMPVMDGFALVQKLKADKRTRHIPIILLTAADEEYGLLNGLEAGATDYMTKPFDFTVLLAKIKSLLSLNQSFKETYTKQVSVALPEEEIVSEKEKFLQKVVAYIQDHMTDSQLSVETLSAYLSISRASLYNRMLEFTGTTPVEFIRSVKLERAAYLLKKSDMTIAEVAYETGFANPNYFTKVFKTKYKLTPSEFMQSVSRNLDALTEV